MCLKEHNNIKWLISPIIPPTPRSNLFILGIWNNILRENKTVCSPFIYHVLPVLEFSLIYFKPRNNHRVNFSLPWIAVSSILKMCNTVLITLFFKRMIICAHYYSWSPVPTSQLFSHYVSWQIVLHFALYII